MNTLEKERQTCPSWEDTREELQEQINERSPAVWKSWFEPVTGSVEEGEGGSFLLRLEAPTKFHAQWIRDNYLPVIKSIWRQFAPGGEIILTVQPESKKKEKDLQTKTKGEVIQLPLWPEDKRGTPNCFLRSALFSAIYGNEDRKNLKNALLAVQGDCSIHYTGEQLAQNDKDFLMVALHLARQHPLGHVCHFRGYSFLKMLGRSNSAPNYHWLDATIMRLIATAVKIRIGQRTFVGSLLTNCKRDEGTDVYKLTFDPEFLKLYGADDWTAIDWETHKRLGRSPLAKWIYDYAVSHVGSTIKIDTLQKLSGRAGETRKLFNKAFKRATAILEVETDVRLSIDANELVSINHKLSPSQLRHKAKKASQSATRRSGS